MTGVDTEACLLYMAKFFNRSWFNVNPTSQICGPSLIHDCYTFML